MFHDSNSITVTRRDCLDPHGIPVKSPFSHGFPMGKTAGYGSLHLARHAGHALEADGAHGMRWDDAPGGEGFVEGEMVERRKCCTYSDL